MKIGLVSDSHDNLVNINKAVDIFNKKGVDFVLHAGDFVAPFSLLSFSNLKCDWRGVFGNCDGEKKGLVKKSKDRITAGQLSIDLGDRKIIVIHDLDEYNKEKAAVVVFGHTHKAEINRVGGGAVCKSG
ncbi:MAG: YfcE family phosphodiesterase [Candidatus Saelkia tenebricola]|nr:YfcE family phosphodiesterase [Candidatus Saelkia tenebricola]